MLLPDARDILRTTLALLVLPAVLGLFLLTMQHVRTNHHNMPVHGMPDPSAIYPNAAADAELLEVVSALTAHTEHDEDGEGKLVTIAPEEMRARTRRAEKALADGANVNAQDASYGDPALSLAIGNRYDAIARMLIARGANVNLGEAAGRAPLAEAARTGNVAMAALLLRLGAHVNAMDRNGNTALACAVTRPRCVAMARLLLDHGASVDPPVTSGATPLIEAVRYERAGDDLSRSVPCCWIVARTSMRGTSTVTVR